MEELPIGNLANVVMTTAPETIECDLLVIGAGMAGMAAACFAASRGVNTAQVGITGEIIYASGLLDLLGVYPAAARRIWDDPWAAIAAMHHADCNHPYARLTPEQIESAFAEFLTHLDKAKLPYQRRQSRNTAILTPAGTVKQTYAVPKSMWIGTEALKHKWPCLIVDIKGLKGFSGRQIVEVLKDRWPALRCERIEWPDIPGEVYAERLARQLELPQHRRRLARILTEKISHEKALGLPAVLGIENSSLVIDDLENRIGCPVFEIPMLPPAVTGMRLREALVCRLATLGVRTFYQMKVLKAAMAASGGFDLNMGYHAVEARVRAKAVVLASGRFIGQGLAGDRTGVRETIFGLPVLQPEARHQWHRLDFFDPRGHAINGCGVEIDRSFRPVDRKGRVVHPRLFAAGAILAHADWMRLKCGSGLAIASAFGAVNAYLNEGSVKAKT